MTPLVEIRNLDFSYRRKSKFIPVLHQISLTIEEGSTLALVGESGSGKTTLAKLLTCLYKPTSGEILYQGTPLLHPRKEIQMVFQDPYSSLNPRMRVRDILLEPLEVTHYEKNHKERINELLSLVALDPTYENRYPFELSGGQRQRIAIARALATNPHFLILDEPTSALDICTGAQILHLLKELQISLNLTYLLITHNMGILKRFAKEVAILQKGHLLEIGSATEIVQNPRHPYTQMLFRHIPSFKDPLEETHL